MTGVRMVTLNAPVEFNPHFADTFARDGAYCPTCCEMAIEAWERMTTGGVQVIRHRSEFTFGKDICEALVNGEEQGMFLAAR